MSKVSSLAKYLIRLYVASMEENFAGPPSFIDTGIDWRYPVDFILLKAKLALVPFFLFLFFGWTLAYADDMAIYEQEADSGASLPDNGHDSWRILENGLEFNEFVLEDADSELAALRIDPEKFDFVLGASGKDGSAPMTLAQWASQKKLSAAINASMYLPDNRTSTGYMRYGNYTNNAKIVKRFGAFFVAGPRRHGLPQAALIESDHPDLQGMLDNYDLVIQNYRIINADGRVLWNKGGPRYAISAVGQDGNGRIMFLHSRKPVEAWTFAHNLLKLPLDIRSVMYVEGGAQAGLVVDAGDLHREMGAPHARSLIITGNLRAVLPNILGIRPKSAAKSGSH